MTEWMSSFICWRPAFCWLDVAAVVASPPPWTHPATVFRDDYLLRQIHELSAAIERAFDHHAAGDVEAGLEELRQAMDALLGPNRSLVDTLDLASVGALLGADKMRSMARLRAAEATLHEASGDARAHRRLPA